MNSYHAELRSKLLTSCHDSKVFWNLIKTRNTSSLPNISIDAWKAHFQNLFQNGHNHLQCEVKNGENIVHHDVLDAPILPDEIRHAIRKIRVSKAPGLDGIPEGCYKAAAEKIIPFLVELFNTKSNS